MRKVKITYLSGTIVKSAIFFSYNPYNLMNEAINYGVDTYNILKIEYILEADEMNTQDFSQKQQL